MKKLLILLSIGFTNITIPINVVSCNQYNNLKLSITNQHKNVIDAINLKNNKNLNDNIKLEDILKWNKLTYKNINNNIIRFNYDVLIKKNTNTFLNIKYRIVNEIYGNFNIIDNKIENSSDKYNLGYINSKLINEVSYGNTLLGKGKNCILYIDEDTFGYFINSPDPIDSLKSFHIENKYVTLTNKQLSKITDDIHHNPKYIIPTGDYGVTLVIKNANLEYTNIIKDHYNDLPMVDGHFISSFINISNDNMYSNYYIDENILDELNDIYTSYKNNEAYGKTYWNIKDINNLFVESNYVLNHKNMIPKSLSFATSIYNFFNNHYNDQVLNLLNYYSYNDYNSSKHQDRGIYLSFDKNNNFISDIYENDNFI